MENQFLIENNINEYVKFYSKRILKDPIFYEADEAYKYKAVATFQKEFDLEAKNLAVMLEKALADAHNLVQSGQYYPKNMLIRFAQKNEIFVRNLLKTLLENNKLVSERIDYFIKEIKKEFSLINEQHYIDARFLSFFLASSCPEKYFYVKPKEYKKFANMVGYNLALEGSQGNRYEAMAELSEVTREILRMNDSFKQVHKVIVEKFDYRDTSIGWGTFDFIFDVARREGAVLDPVNKKINWQARLVEAKKESIKDLLSEEESFDETVVKSKNEILVEASGYRPKETEGYRQKTGQYKTRVDNTRQKIRIKILEDYICQVCGSTFEYQNSDGKIRKYAEADHIIDKIDGGTEELGNLWVLCANCHMKKTLGVINIDPNKKIVRENGKDISIRDNHLGWHK